jgi:hypothetical protein
MNTYQTLQTVLDYCAIAPVICAVGLLGLHLVRCWQSTAPSPTVAPVAALSRAVPAVSLAVPALSCAVPDLSPGTDGGQVGDIQPDTPTPEPMDEGGELLAIPATARSLDIPESSLVPLGKLYGVPGAGKWSMRRSLRPGERAAVLLAIGAA